MDKFPQTLDVPPTYGAILYHTGHYKLFRAFINNWTSDPARIESSGENIRNLKTERLRQCAGVMYENKTNYVLIHAANHPNLRALLSRLNEVSFEDANQEPQCVYLCTPNGWAGYSKTIESVFQRQVPLRMHHLIGPQNQTNQSIMIGKDIIDVGDNRTPPTYKQLVHA